MIAIIDYGMGNIHSVQKALQLFGAETLVTNKPADIRSCEKLVLPGVGAFDEAMQELARQDLVEAIKAHIGAGKTFLGICLGLQLLFESSEEAAGVRGLSLLKGSVRRFEPSLNVKVPHMGWNQLRLTAGNSHSANTCPLLAGIADGSYAYFCHSYYPQPMEKGDAAAFCGYGLEFAAAVWKDNIYGAQFHPEKSQAVGLKMLENFVNLC